MFLALRDLRFARGRFLLMGAVVCLIAVLAVVLTGLSSGLVADGVSGLRRLPATHLAFQRGVSGDVFSRSTVDTGDLTRWSTRPGVRRAAAYGNRLTHVKVARTGKDVDLAVFGMEPGSFIAPAPATGRPLGSVPDGVLVPRRLADSGVRIGDTLVVEHSQVPMTVVGTVGDASFGHVDVVYAPLRTWQRIDYGLPGTPPAEAFRQATAIALDGAPTSTAGLDAHVLARSDSYSASPGFSAETSTMKLIQFFLYTIAIFVVGAFFVVWTVQRKDEIALVRALGGSAGYLVRDALAQVLVVLLTAITAGAAVGLAIILAVESAGSVPIAIEPASLATAVVLLITLGVLGTVAALRRITSVDPLLALGGNR